MKGDLRGNWKGYFKYGKGYPANSRSRKNPFEIRVKFYDGAFSGLCDDNYTRLFFKSPAVIDGVLNEKKISFIKRYPGLLTMNENGQAIADYNQPPIPVRYEGRLKKRIFSKRYYFKGTWYIDYSFIDGDGIVNNYSSSGSWRMEKDEVTK